MSAAASAWNRFWFATAPATTLAMLRAGVALLAAATAALLWPDLGDFYAETMLGTVGAAVVTAVLFVASTALFVGGRTRLSSTLVALGLVLLAIANPIVFNSGDALLRHLAVIVALAPAGAAWSLDRRRACGAFWTAAEAPIWPLRLAQIQIAVMYAATVAHKLRGTTWIDGTAASYPLRISAATRFPLLADAAADPAVAALLTWGTLAIETAIPLLVWARRARPWVLALGVALHLAIECTLRAGLFSWVVWLGYLAFVSPEALERVVARRRMPRRAPAETATIA